MAYKTIEMLSKMSKTPSKKLFFYRNFNFIFSVKQDYNKTSIFFILSYLFSSIKISVKRQNSFHKRNY